MKTLKELVSEGFTPMHSLDRDKWNALTIPQEEVVLLHYTGKIAKISEVVVCEHQREFDHLWIVIFLVR